MKAVMKALLAFDMNLPFSVENFDLPINRDLPIRPPHKAKVEGMTNWDQNPFKHLELVLISKKDKSKWRFREISIRVECKGCQFGNRANKLCIAELCHVCCKALDPDPKCKQHKREGIAIVAL